jgi:hypothetical protein
MDANLTLKKYLEIALLIKKMQFLSYNLRIMMVLGLTQV